VKKTAKLLLILICVVLIASSFAACSKKDIPDGYQLVAREGDNFRLYVPTRGWMPNTDGGITGAYYSVIDDETDSPIAYVRVYTPDDSEGCKTVEEYWEICDAKLSAELKEYKYIESESGKTVLGGQSAHKYVYTAQMGVGTEGNEIKYVPYKFMQIITVYRENIYVMMFSALESEYANRLVDMNGNPDEEDKGIIGNFRFAEPYSSDEKKKYDKKVDIPEGMKLASTKERPYTLFMPDDGWSIERGANITTVSTSDKSNLTVQYTMPDGTDHDIQKYWDKCIEDYKNVMTVGEEISKATKKIGGVDGGIVGEFSGVSGGVEYRFKQAIVLKGDVFYVITYTATAENYDKHISDVNKMIDNFIVK